MNFGFFIAKRIRDTKGKAFSSTITKVGVASVAIGLAVLLISFSVLLGFKNTIKRKLFTLNSHISISKVTLNQSLEETPIDNYSLIEEITSQNPEIDYTNKVAFKSAILKSKQEISGIIIKGLDKEYKWRDFEENIIEGRKLNLIDSAYSKEILISEILKNKMAINLNDEVLVYFVQDPPRARKLKVVGIYNSGIPELDNSFVMGDIRLIRKMNLWNDGAVGHFEVFIKDFQNLNKVNDYLKARLPIDFTTTKIDVSLSQFFDWFNLLDRNLWIVITLIIFVASFNMISVLLIMVMERTPMIGLLKSLGSTNFQIRSIFIVNGIQIILKGLVLGNIIGLGICYLQDKFKIIKLDPENYYMNYVPIEWNFEVFLLVNLCTFIVVSLTVMIPTFIIPQISPIEALKFKD